MDFMEQKSFNAQPTRIREWEPHLGKAGGRHHQQTVKKDLEYSNMAAHLWKSGRPEAHSGPAKSYYKTIFM
ncbi:hypothetical protein DWB84_02975 [Saccharophagus sp. K07]|uniref:hypothetical protein n=1 Tax=Saccharophagus sp. K07 TaxID=2283636 RepID=UPI00165256C5|nr:hypothetical protein [Saccharophagus sp. K07]MBC6904430.1 hypothetical protein [Saccharophagus sp. K07]